MNVPNVAMSGGDMSKPPYVIPSMKDISEIEPQWNAISTFSGAGGSSLGLKMAGYRVRWASEFVPAASEVYRLNHQNTPLDERDIRQVSGEDILSSIGVEAGSIDLLEGSPPCASFSMSGKRDKKWGQVVKYSDTEQRVDDLFYEFARLVKEIQPKVFIAENVSGLIRGRAKGYFKEIFKALQDCGYEVSSALLNAQWLGVPQSRERIFFQGVRKDLGKKPVFPKPFKYCYALKDILPYARKVMVRKDMWRNSERTPPTVVASGATITETAQMGGVGMLEVDFHEYAIAKEWKNLKQGEKSNKYYNLSRPHLDKPSPTITAQGGNLGAAAVVHPVEFRKYTIEELKLVQSFPADFKLTGTFQQQWERLGRSVPPLMMKEIASTIAKEVLDG